MALQTCPKDGITSFPLTLTSNPTLADYEARMEVITMDFQWGPLTTGLVPDKSSNQYIILQKDDKASTVLYKSTRYNVYSVQITKATHSNWLITSPMSGPSSTNKEDLIITLVSSDYKSHDTYIIIVVPIIRSPSAIDPAYLANIGKPSSTSYDLGSCLPPKTGPNTGDIVFAMYSTCINGYTGRADTQNVYVLVSTSGILVSDSLMNSITNGATLIANSIYKPASFAYMNGGVSTQIDVTDFSKFITSTRYLTDTTAEKLVETRKDKTDQYKCMELDPDAQMDANGNMVIDVNKGEITNLNDIVAEREILKAMVAPTSAESATRRMVGTIIEYVMAMIVILFVILVIFVTFYATRDWMNLGLGLGISLCFLLAAILGLVGFKTNATNLYTGSYILCGLGVLGFLIWFPIWQNASQAATVATAAVATATGTATGTGTGTGSSGTGVAAATTPVAGFDPSILISKIPVYSVIAVVSLLGGFVIGSFAY